MTKIDKQLDKVYEELEDMSTIDRQQGLEIRTLRADFEDHMDRVRVRQDSDLRLNIWNKIMEVKAVAKPMEEVLLDAEAVEIYIQHGFNPYAESAAVSAMYKDAINNGQITPEDLNEAKRALRMLSEGYSGELHLPEGAQQFLGIMSLQVQNDDDPKPSEIQAENENLYAPATPTDQADPEKGYDEIGAIPVEVSDAEWRSRIKDAPAAEEVHQDNPPAKNITDGGASFPKSGLDDAQYPYMTEHAKTVGRPIKDIPQA